MSNIYQFTCKWLPDRDISLKEYENKVLLIVNTASKCGFTPQYQGLEELQKTYEDQGFSVLAFPCNQFGQQEPGNQADIQSFCDLTYQTSFPVLQKVEVNGDNADPIYRFLKSKAPGILGTRRIKWNFTKFLINRQGEVISRFAPKDKPASLTQQIEALL